jgi:predicted RNA binding protein YcfA (HicA-like mRNA interferase family)
MPRLRRLSSGDVLRVLGRSGFQVATQRGSHAKLVRIAPGGEKQVLVVPVHGDLATGTLHAIYRQAARLAPSVELRRAFFAD